MEPRYKNEIPSNMESASRRIIDLKQSKLSVAVLYGTGEGAIPADGVVLYALAFSTLLSSQVTDAHL
jgi:hypothetical protein